MSGQQRSHEPLIMNATNRPIIKLNGISLTGSSLASTPVGGPPDPVERRNPLKALNDRIPARYVLYFLSWSGFLVSFMMRNDINFALVAMVAPVEPSADANATLVSGSAASDTFAWSSGVQSIIIGSFYWCYVLAQVAGGVATQHFGTKHVFGWSQFATAISSLLIPASADLHYAALITLRSIQGFASGLTWPAMYAIVPHWIPPSERSRFMSSFQGFSIGIGLTYPLCGFIIARWGWRWVFQTTGTIGLLWCAAWWLLAYDTPAQHPRISRAELKYISLHVGAQLRRPDATGSTAGGDERTAAPTAARRVPWLKIFGSLPVWSIGVTTFGRIWVHYTFIMFGPMYMKHVLGFEIERNGWLSGMPFVCSYVSSVGFCWLADRMVASGIRLTSVRKLFTAASQIVPGLMCVWIGWIGRDRVLLVLCVWFVAVTMITASYAGAMASIVDVAPNLAGPVLAFAQTIHMTASFVSPVLSGLILQDKADIDQWRTVFALAAIVAVSTYAMFQVYGTSDIQPWNYPTPATSQPDLRTATADDPDKTTAEQQRLITAAGCPPGERV